MKIGSMCQKKNRKMKRFVHIWGLIGLCVVSSCIPTSENPGLSNEQVVAGLKEALQVGTDTAVSILSLTDGYYGDELVKILLPDEANVIIDNIQLIPGGEQLVEDLVLRINRSAEDAAQQATPIFVDAITNITFSDAMNILKGHDTAATDYLKDKTFDDLTSAFLPDVTNSLEKPIIAGQSAQSTWQELTNTYNALAIILPSIEPIETDLALHVTEKALDGLFLKVSEEEKSIREDPVARVTSILEQVFGSLDG